jgi:hypothetical protein
VILLICKQQQFRTATISKEQAMATTTNTQHSFEAPFEQFKEANDQILAAARKAGALYVDSYEQVVDRALDIESRFAATAQPEWLKSLIESHVDLSRELTSAYVNTARNALK